MPATFPADWEDPDLPSGENPDFPGAASDAPPPAFTPPVDFTLSVVDDAYRLTVLDI